MAVFHVSAQMIGRSSGRSSVACAAYRSGQELTDERLGKTFDYSRKDGVLDAQIFVPANAPAWMLDREKLWNAVEAKEHRKDAQLAREFQISLPRELTIEQNKSLIHDYVKQAFVSRGMVADVCLHVERASDGGAQPHAHIMLTTREVTPDGFGKKAREWNDKALLVEQRALWETVANHHLALNGHDMRIDHRTLEAQGIDLLPQTKIGPQSARDRLAALEDHQRRARENGERLLANPALALKAITQQQSTFTHRDVARFVNRHTVDAEQFQAVYDTVMACPELMSVGRDDRGVERLTTREQREMEHRLLAHAELGASEFQHRVSTRVREQVETHWKLDGQQLTAYRHIVEKGDVTGLIGYAGTGKSYLLGAAREAWEREGYKVHGVTLSGIAAENLEASSGITSRTFASRSYYWRNSRESLTSKDILVVDEAGMLGSRQFSELMKEARKAKAKVVLIGDPQQLQAIEAGGAFRGISERVDTEYLTEIRRQHELWQKEATKALAEGKTPMALDAYCENGYVHESKTGEDSKNQLLDHWHSARQQHPDKSDIILSYLRADTAALNEGARARRLEAGELGESKTFTTEVGAREFAIGERLYFLKNDRDLKVKNGTLGTIKAFRGHSLIVELDKEEKGKKREVAVNTLQYKHLEYGYASTIHKSQGATVDRTYFLTSEYVDAHAAYVAMSRHRESVQVYWSHDRFKEWKDVCTTLARERGKDMTTDYGVGQQVAAIPDVKLVPEKEMPQQQQTVVAKQSPHVDSLEAFARQFEANNPELSRTIHESFDPKLAHEKDMQQQVAYFERLEKAASQHLDRKDVEIFKSYVVQLSKNEAFMTHIKQQHGKIFERLQLHVKEHERQQSLNISFDIER